LGYKSFETGGRPGRRFLEEGPMHPLRGEFLLTLDLEETEDKVIPEKFSIIEKNNLKSKGDVYEDE
jgi:hypothetical protein